MFDPDQVRTTLPPLDLVGPVYLAATTRSYLDHYGLLFGNEFPGLEQRIGTLPCDGELLVVQVFRPLLPRGTAFILHGYFDHTGLYGHVIRYCLQRQLQVVIFDQPGHGLSSGEPASIDSFERYVRAFRAVRDLVQPLASQPWHLLAQSMGGAVAIEYLLSSGYRAANSPYRNVVLFAPLVRPYQWPVLRLLYYPLGGLLREWPRGAGGNSGDEAFNRFLREQDPLQAKAVMVRWVRSMAQWQRRLKQHTPTDIAPIILQGGADRTVDAPYNLRAISKLFRPVVHHQPTAQHHMVNETAALRAEMFARIDASWRE